MKKRIVPDALSLCSLLIETYFGGEKLGIGTGFPWRSEDITYLVTNGHVISGIHPETGQPISQAGATPDRIVVWLHQKSNLGSWAPSELDLQDAQGRPLWFEHPREGPKIDVAVLPVDVGDDTRLFPINELEYVEFRLEV